jgi:hypothetical protein
VFRQSAAYLFVALHAVVQPQAFATITIKPAPSAEPREEQEQTLRNGDLVASAIAVIRLLSYTFARKTRRGTVKRARTRPSGPRRRRSS